LFLFSVVLAAETGTIGLSAFCQTSTVVFEHQFQWVSQEVAMTTRIEFDEDDDWLDADDEDLVYNQHYGFRVSRPEWMHPECTDIFQAFEYGTCCKYPVDALVNGTLYLAELVDGVLTEFDCGNADCAQTARLLGDFLEVVPALVAEIHAALPDRDREASEQLLCPVNRLALLVLELSLRPGCPMACTVHGAPDRRPGLAPLVPVLEECQEALRAAVLPRPPHRRGP
jgi:hypothetical protein